MSPLLHHGPPVTIGDRQLTREQAAAVRVALYALLTRLECPIEREAMGPLAEPYREHGLEVERLLVAAAG